MNYRIPNKPILVRCSWESRHESYPMSELSRIQSMMEDEEELDKQILVRATGESFSLYDKIPQTTYPSPEEICLSHDKASDLVERLNHAISILTPTQRAIVRCVLSHLGEPLSVTAAELGISRERVRQVMNRYHKLVIPSKPIRTDKPRRRKPL